MSEYKPFYIPEEFVFNSTTEAMDKYPDQAVSVLWDLSDMKSAYDAMKAERDINNIAFENLGDKLKRANERIVEFEVIKKSHSVYVQEILEDVKPLIDALNKCVREYNNRSNTTGWQDLQNKNNMKALSTYLEKHGGNDEETK